MESHDPEAIARWVRGLPDQAQDWDEETKQLAHELVLVGRKWERNREERAQLSERRGELYEELERRQLSHSLIGRLASSTKGAVEQVLVVRREKARSG